MSIVFLVETEKDMRQNTIPNEQIRILIQNSISGIKTLTPKEKSDAILYLLETIDFELGEETLKKINTEIDSRLAFGEW